MSTAMKALIGIVAVVLLSTIMTVGCALGVNNDCARAENGIKAQYDENQNNYANYFNKLKEMAQVPTIAEKHLEELYKTAISGRYGQDGSKAMFQFIQEQNPNIDPKLYERMQEVIESGRNSFEADQKTLIDKKNVYQNILDQMPGGMVAHMFGFPKIDLTKFGIVTNDETQQAFATKKAGPIQIQ